MIRYYVVVYRDGVERQRLGPYPLRRAQRIVDKYLAAGRGAIVRAVDERGACAPATPALGSETTSTEERRQ